MYYNQGKKAIKVIDDLLDGAYEELRSSYSANEKDSGLQTSLRIIDTLLDTFGKDIDVQKYEELKQEYDALALRYGVFE